MLIQKLRLQRGWSQEQLGEISGLSPRTIQRLERGQPASLESLKALSAAFEIDLNQLQEPAMDTTQTQNLSTRDVQDPNERRALARVRKLKRFYLHVMQYVLVISFLFAINLMTYPKFLWAVFPALGWGVGLMMHGLSIWSHSPLFGAEWERRQVEKYLGRKL